MSLLYFATLFISIVSSASDRAVLPEALVLNEIKNKKIKLESADLKSREVMATIYTINQRMKNMSKKRDSLNNKMIAAQGNVKSLARSIIDVEGKITKQRELLQRRLKAIYMMGDEGAAKIIFSSLSAQDFDQSLKYLKLISDNDYRLIKSYSENRMVLNKKRDRLKSEVKNMTAIKAKLNHQESQLNRDQEAKSNMLRSLKLERENVLRSLSAIRHEADKKNIQDLLNVSFYEKKGRLQEPISGELMTGFSLIESEEFRYRLSHKGFRYRVLSQSDVRSVFEGLISFVGAVSGYGNTIVIDHNDHYYSVYANVDQVLVTEGQLIKENSLIAKTKESLYFEIRHFSDAIDPKPWLQVKR